MIVAPDVEHGSAMILRLPSGKHVLIDCGKSMGTGQYFDPHASQAPDRYPSKLSF